MRQSQFPLRVNVGFTLMLQPGESREMSFHFATLIFEPELTMKEFKGVVNFVRTRQGVLAQGDFEATIDQACTRCLEEFPYPIYITFEELYAFEESNMTESELILPEDGFIDLQPLVREYFVLEIPIQPVCKPDCKGLCPVCGENRNLVSCGHETTNL